jgi:hypothetical protein
MNSPDAVPISSCDAAEYSASVSAGFGPTLGGFLVGWASWPAIFLGEHR